MISQLRLKDVTNCDISLGIHYSVCVQVCSAISISRCHEHAEGQDPLHWGTPYLIVNLSLQVQVEIYMYHLKLTRAVVDTTEPNLIITITHLKFRHIVIVITLEITLIYSSYLPQI